MGAKILAWWNGNEIWGVCHSCDSLDCFELVRAWPWFWCWKVRCKSCGETDYGVI